MFRQLSKQIVLFFLVVLPLLTACNSQTTTPTHPPLKVEWTFWPGDYPMAIADELDLFEKHGVQVEPVLYETYFNAMTDIASDLIDGGFFVPGDLLLTTTTGADIVGVAVVDTSDGADQVVAMADIETPADLVGKEIGVDFGTFGELFVRRMLETYDVSPTEVTLVDLLPEEVPGAIPTTIQAGHTWEPHTSAALENNQRIIFSSAETPGLIADVLAFRREVIEERPEDIEAFIAAWFEAVVYWQENPEEGNEIIARYLNLPVGVVSFEGVKLFDRADNVAAFQRGNDTTSIYYTTQLYIDFMLSMGGLNEEVQVEQLLDPRFVQGE